MYCGTCGAMIAPGANFCGNCGASLTNARSRPLPAGTVGAAAPARPLAARPMGAPPSAPPFPAPPLSPPGPMYPLSAAPPANPSVPAERKSAFLAGLLECLVPGVGLMYAGVGWAGALVLVATALASLLLLLIGLGMAPHARPAALLRYFLFCVTVLFLWLVARAVWAALAAHRRDDAARPAAPMATPPGAPLRGDRT